MKIGEIGGIWELLILNLAQCRISSERHADCAFQRRVPMSIHHRTTPGQIHWKQSNPLSDYCWSAAGKFPNLQVFSTEASCRSIVRKKTTVTGRSEAISPSHFFSQASTLFVATRMSAGISDWLTFEVCIVYICLIWEDWPSLILSWHIWWEGSHKELCNYVLHAGVLWGGKYILFSQMLVIPRKH